MDVSDLIRGDSLPGDTPNITVIVEETTTVFGGVLVQVADESPALFVFEGAGIPTAIVFDTRVTDEADIRITDAGDTRIV